MAKKNKKRKNRIVRNLNERHFIDSEVISTFHLFLTAR